MRLRFAFLALLLTIPLTACNNPNDATDDPSDLVTEVITETVINVITDETTSAAAEGAQLGNQSSIQLPAVDPLDVSGDIVTAGSSTVFPLAEALAERFRAEGYAGNITIDSIGSGAGFERFCVEGESDVANASRPIRDSEIESCSAIGRQPLEFRVGTDALAVVVSAANSFVTELTVEELALVFGSAETWADVNPAWPAESILRFIPGTDSGTFDFFVEAIFDEDEGPILTAANTQLSEDDNVLVQGIEGSPYAVGFFGYAYYRENAAALTILNVDGVEPSAASVENGTYPLARPLLIYSDAALMRAKPQVAAFINFYLTYANEEVLAVGYFPASTASLNRARLAWAEALGIQVAAPSTATSLPAVDPLDVSGDIVTAGSSTVFPLAEALAERFRAEGYAGNITIDSIGSGAGFERFCVEGESDVANASRPIRDSEIESCSAIGRQPLEFRVGTDALAVVVSAANSFVTELTVEELALVFGSAETWADVNPAWPAESILRFIPGTDSGTFDFFVEAIFDEDEGPILTAANTQLSEDDNVLVQGIEGSPYAVGFFGYAYYRENAAALTILNIDGVEPSAASVENGSYPLARPLLIYSDAGLMRAKPQVAAFINFYLTYANEEVLAVGYFPASTAALITARTAWLDAAR